MVLRDYAKNKKSKARRTSRGSGRGSKKSSARSNRSNRSGKQKNSSLVINFNPMLVLVILVGGLFVGSVFYLEYSRDFFNKTNNHTQTIVKKIKDISKESPKKLASIESAKTQLAKHLPKFEFYHTLPKMGVAVNKPENNLKQLNDKTIQTTNLTSNQKTNHITKKLNNNSYVLQLASFKDIKDAEELRARLILAGFDVTVQTVKLANRDTWHRVKSKKLTDIAMAEKLSLKLQQYNLKSIILTEKSVG